MPANLRNATEGPCRDDGKALFEIAAEPRSQEWKENHQTPATPEQLVPCPHMLEQDEGQDDERWVELPHFNHHSTRDQ